MSVKISGKSNEMPLRYLSSKSREMSFRRVSPAVVRPLWSSVTDPDFDDFSRILPQSIAKSKDSNSMLFRNGFDGIRLRYAAENLAKNINVVRLGSH